jgi:hypothetical protein
VTQSGKIYVAHPFKRLNADGSEDESLPTVPIRRDNIVLDVADNVYVAGDFFWEKYSPAGVVDPAFNGISSSDSLWEISGLLFKAEATSDFHRVRRLTATGAVDPGFTPITNLNLLPGPGGTLFAITTYGKEISVERFNPDGTRDAAYLRGTLDVPYDSWSFAMLQHGSGALAFGAFGGAALYCSNAQNALARVDFDISGQRFMVDPNRRAFSEREAGGGGIVLIRAGDNSSAATTRYRVRPGSAAPGEHYALSPAAGEVQFESGVSRVILPMTILDNSRPELDSNFFVDLLGPDDQLLSSSEITIRNDDVGLQILSRDHHRVRLLPIAGELPNLILQTSPDLEHWQNASYGGTGIPVELPFDESALFFRVFAYTNWRTP